MSQLPSLLSRQLEEKARLEAEARAREHVHAHGHAHAEQRPEPEEDARLAEELRRLQELQKLRAVKKKKKERPAKDCPKLDMLAGALQAAAGPGPDPAHLHNGSLGPTEDPAPSPPSPSGHTAPTEPGPGTGGDSADPRDSTLLLPEGVSAKQQEPLSFLLDIMRHHKAGTGKQKPKQAGKAGTELGGGPAEPSRPCEGQPRPRPQTEPKAKARDLSPLVEPKREERKANSNNNNKKQLNHVKEGKASPGPTEPTCAGEHPPGSKLALADSPRPRGKSKKSRRKKGDRAGSSLGKWEWAGVCAAGPVALSPERGRQEPRLSVPGPCRLQTARCPPPARGQVATVVPSRYFEIILGFLKDAESAQNSCALQVPTPAFFRLTPSLSLPGARRGAGPVRPLLPKHV